MTYIPTAPISEQELVNSLFNYRKIIELQHSPQNREGEISVICRLSPRWSWRIFRRNRSLTG